MMMVTLLRSCASRSGRLLRVAVVVLAGGVAVLFFHTSAANAQGPVGHWKFDEAAGKAIDGAGSNDGTLAGDPVRVFGLFNGGLKFDGAGFYV